MDPMGLIPGFDLVGRFDSRCQSGSGLLKLMFGPWSSLSRKISFTGENMILIILKISLTGENMILIILISVRPDFEEFKTSEISTIHLRLLQFHL